MIYINVLNEDELKSSEVDVQVLWDSSVKDYRTLQLKTEWWSSYLLFDVKSYKIICKQAIKQWFAKLGTSLQALTSFNLTLINICSPRKLHPLSFLCLYT